MGKKILINASQPEESRIAIVQDGKLHLFEIQTAREEQLKGNIYKGKVANVNPSLQAAFVDIGFEKPAFSLWMKLTLRISLLSSLRSLKNQES